MVRPTDLVPWASAVRSEAFAEDIALAAPALPVGPAVGAGWFGWSAPTCWRRSTSVRSSTPALPLALLLRARVGRW